MAPAVLQNGHKKNFVHIPLYDLQSFFFVFIWICITFRAPGLQRTALPSPVAGWVMPDLSINAAAKSGQVASSPNFNSFLVPHFSDYFKDLTEFADKFREVVLFDMVIHNSDNWLTNTKPHDHVIALFDAELAKRAQNPSVATAVDPLETGFQHPDGLRRSPRDMTAITREKIAKHFEVGKQGKRS